MHASFSEGEIWHSALHQEVPRNSYVFFFFNNVSIKTLNIEHWCEVLPKRKKKTAGFFLIDYNA